MCVEAWEVPAEQGSRKMWGGGEAVEREEEGS